MPRIGVLSFLIKRLRYEKVIVIDKKEIKPNTAKEVAEWQWTKFKWRKFIVYVGQDGEITVKDLIVRKRRKR